MKRQTKLLVALILGGMLTAGYAISGNNSFNADPGPNPQIEPLPPHQGVQGSWLRAFGDYWWKHSHQ